MSKRRERSRSRFPVLQLRCNFELLPVVTRSFLIHLLRVVCASQVPMRSALSGFVAKRLRSLKILLHVVHCLGHVPNFPVSGTQRRDDGATQSQATRADF